MRDRLPGTLVCIDTKDRGRGYYGFSLLQSSSILLFSLHPTIFSETQNRKMHAVKKKKRCIYILQVP